MRTLIISLLGLLLLGSFIGTGVFLYQKSSQPPVVYETTQPFVTDILNKTVATGSIVPRKEVAMKSQVAGVVDQLFVEEGQLVNVGDQVARIRIIPNMVALNNAEAQVAKAKINFEDARSEYRRQQDLLARGIIADFEFKPYILDYSLREQELASAQSNLELVREGASKTSGNQSNVVFSTVQGMVLDVPVKQGTFIIETNTFNEGTTIASVADMSEMIFEGKVDESEVGKIREGMPLKLTVGAIEGAVFDAELEFISPKGELDNGAIKFDIRAAIDLQENYFLRAGYSATADIVLRQVSAVLAVKEKDLIFEGDKALVEIQVAEQQFKKQAVEIGLSDGINIQVTGGLDRNSVIKQL